MTLVTENIFTCVYCWRARITKRFLFFKSSLDSDCLKLSLTCPLEGSRRFVDKTMGNNKLQNPNQCIGMYYIEDAESKRLNLDQHESINKKKKRSFVVHAVHQDLKTHAL